MPVSQLPQAPYRQDRKLFPTPLVGDVLFSEVRDCNRSDFPAYGTPHPNTKKWPNHKLIYIKPVDIERNEIFEFVYAADREEQDKYNFAFGYRNLIGNAGGREFRIVTRTYLTPRADFDPQFPAFKEPMPDVPEGTFEGINYVFFDKKQVKSEPEFDSLYVIEERTYVEEAFLDLKLSYSAQKPDVVPDKFRESIPNVTTEEIQEGVAAIPVLTGDDLSVSEDQLNPNVKLVKTTSRADVALPVVLPDGELIVSDYGGIVAKRKESLVVDGTSADSGFGIIESSVTTLGNGQSVKTTIQAPLDGNGSPIFPTIEGVFIDPRYGVPFVTAKQVVPPTTVGGLYSGGGGSVGSVEIEPKNQWHSVRNITYLPSLPDPQVWYGLRRENLPDVLLDIGVVGTEKFVPVPAWARVPDGPMKAKHTRSFSYGPPVDFDPSLSRVYYATEAFYGVLEYESTSITASTSSGTSSTNSSSSGSNASSSSTSSSSSNSSSSSGSQSSSNSSSSSGSQSSSNSSSSSGSQSSSNSSSSSGSQSSSNSSSSSGSQSSSNSSSSSGSQSSSNSSSSSGSQSSSNSSSSSGSQSSSNSSSSSGSQSSSNSSSSSGSQSSSNSSSSSGSQSSSNSSSSSGSQSSSNSSSSSGSQSSSNSSSSSGSQSGSNSSSSSGSQSGSQSSSSSSSSSASQSSSQYPNFKGFVKQEIATRKGGGTVLTTDPKTSKEVTTFDEKAASTSNSNSTATSTSTSTGTNTSTNTGTSTGTSTSTNTGTSTGTSTSTNTGTSTGTSTSTNTGTSTGTSTSTNTGTSTGTNTSTSTGTNTGTNTSTNTGTSTGTNTSTNTGTSTGTNTSTNTGTSTGTNTSTNTGTSTGTSTSTNTTTSTGTNTGTNTGTSTGTNTSTNTSTSTGTSTSTNASTSTGTSTGTNNGTSVSNSTSTSTSLSAGTNTSNSTSSNSSTSQSTGKSLFTLSIPKCLHDEITVELPTGQSMVVPATEPTSLSGWIEVSRQSEHWRNNIWITETIEVYV